MEEKRIAEFEAKELRDKYKEGKRNLAFQYEIERNRGAVQCGAARPTFF